MLVNWYSGHGWHLKEDGLWHFDGRPSITFIRAIHNHSDLWSPNDIKYNDPRTLNNTRFKWFNSMVVGAPPLTKASHGS